MAIAIESLLGLEKYKIYQPNIRMYEMAQLQKVQGDNQQAVMEDQTRGMDPAAAAAVTAQAMGQEGAPPQ
jgi:hypothetical protein